MAGLFRIQGAGSPIQATFADRIPGARRYTAANLRRVLKAVSHLLLYAVKQATPTGRLGNLRRAQAVAEVGGTPEHVGEVRVGLWQQMGGWGGLAALAYAGYVHAGRGEVRPVRARVLHWESLNIDPTSGKMFTAPLTRLNKATRLKEAIAKSRWGNVFRMRSGPSKANPYLEIAEDAARPRIVAFLDALRES